MWTLNRGVDVKEPIINERAQFLLKSLIERYISDGEPIGSSTLARDSRLDISPATIRNVLADLEKLGLLHSPHTSAGRVPTVQGYRTFIDNLLTIKPLNSGEIQSLHETIESAADTHTMLESASSLLSGITHMAGIVSLPNIEQNILRHIEFLPLSENRVLAILVFSKDDIQNRIILTSRSYTTQELQRIANCLNTEFLGEDVAKVRERILKEMCEAKDDMDRIMVSAIEMANKVFQQSEDKHDYVIAGETNLMQYGEMADVKRLRQLFEAFNEKQGILQLLDQSLGAPGVQIFIGSESGYDALNDCSVVTANYSSNDTIVGSLAVIGPTRMAYDRVIPIVDVTAKIISAALNQRR